jgi:hypothetical protein
VVERARLLNRRTEVASTSVRLAAPPPPPRQKRRRSAPCTSTTSSASSAAARRRTAAVHATQSKVSTAQSLANKARTDLLLRLLVAGRRGEANEQVWAERVRQYLLAQDGQAPPQRALVNAGGLRPV